MSSAIVEFPGLAPRINRAEVAGLTLFCCPTSLEHAVVLRGWLPAGDFFSQTGNPAVPAFTAAMLDQGTTTRDKFAVARKLEEVGATLSFGAVGPLVNFNARCLKEDLPLVVALLAEQLRTPAFSPGEVTKVRKQLAGTWRRRLDNTGVRALEAFRRAVYPVGHPNWTASTEEYLAGFERVTAADLKAFHAQHYGPAHFAVVAAGDVDSSRVESLFREHFAGWTGGVALLGAIPGRMEPPAAGPAIAIPGRTSTNVVWGQATGLRESDPDSLALTAATAVFGSGFTARLMRTVRDQEGLTYGVYAGLSNDTLASGEWAIQAAFAPALLEKGIASIRRQLELWWAEGVSAGELADRKENLVGTHQVGLATTEGLTAAIAQVVQSGRGLAWLDDYPAAVRALTITQVNTAIRNRLDPERMVMVKAGPPPAVAAGA